MEISNQDKKLMISTLGTLRFNSYNDLGLGFHIPL